MFVIVVGGGNTGSQLAKFCSMPVIRYGSSKNVPRCWKAGREIRLNPLFKVMEVRRSSSKERVFKRRRCWRGLPLG